MAGSRRGDEREQDGITCVKEKRRRWKKKAKVRKWQEETQRRWGESDKRCEAGGKVKVKAEGVKTESSRGGKFQGE